MMTGLKLRNTGQLSIEEIVEAETTYPGQVKLLTVTGQKAEILVCGKTWKFEYSLGHLLLEATHPIVPRLLYLYAFHRAREAMHATFRGYQTKNSDTARKKRTPTTTLLQENMLFSSLPVRRRPAKLS